MYHVRFLSPCGRCSKRAVAGPRYRESVAPRPARGTRYDAIQSSRDLDGRGARHGEEVARDDDPRCNQRKVERVFDAEQSIEVHPDMPVEAIVRPPVHQEPSDGKTRGTRQGFRHCRALARIVAPPKSRKHTPRPSASASTAPRIMKSGSCMPSGLGNDGSGRQNDPSGPFGSDRNPRAATASVTITALVDNFRNLVSC